MVGLSDCLGTERCLRTHASLHSPFLKVCSACLPSDLGLALYLAGKLIQSSRRQAVVKLALAPFQESHVN